MDEKKDFKNTGDESYAAVGEEMLRQQGLAPDGTGEAPKDAPVTEYPSDDSIYMDPPEVSDTVSPVQDADVPVAVPVAAGEYVTFSADTQDVYVELIADEEPELEVEPEAKVPAPPYHAMDGGAGPVQPEPPADQPAPAAAAPPPETPAKKDGGLWQTILRPVVALVAICIVTSGLLGLTNGLTEPIIAANTAAAEEAARIALLPEADGFEQVAVPDGMSEVTSIYRATNDTGWIVGAYGRGYGGQVPALVAFGQDGNISGVTFTENSETVGLGQKVREPDFYTQFAGRTAENMTLADIDKIASATISSNAAISAVNAAIEAYHTVSGSGGGSTRPTELEDVLEYLLPGEELTPITLSAQDVQPTAYRSDAGNYVIFGEKPNERPESDSVVVAAVAINSAGEILNLWLDTSGEGEGYGQTLATNQGFINGFIGQSAPAKVDAVADITGSSGSVMAAVNNALDALSLAKEAA